MKLNIKKNTILRYDQVWIFSILLNISTSEIEYSINNNKTIYSTLRIDEHPSVLFKWYKNKLKHIDVVYEAYTGDIFDIAAILNNSIDKFNDTCTFIINTISIYKDKSVTVKPREIRDVVPINKEVININITQQRPSDRFIEFWKKRHLDINYILKENVLDVQAATANGRVIYSKFLDSDLCISYYYGRHQNKAIYELYRPNNKLRKDKFYTNNKQHLDWMYELTIQPRKPYLMITKGSKEKLHWKAVAVNSSHSLFLSGGEMELCYTKFTYVSCRNESIILGRDLCNALVELYDKVFINYDYDLTGVLTSFHLMKTYGFIPIFLQRDISNIKMNKLIINSYIKKYNYDKDELMKFISDNAGDCKFKDLDDCFTYNLNYAMKIVKGLINTIKLHIN